MTNSSVKDLTVLVAGGGSGIGEATARRFAANGARVAVADRRKDMADAVAVGIGEQAGEAIAIGLDVSRQDEIDAGLDALLSRFGQLDVIVNCAGVIKPAELADCRLEDWRDSFTVNVEGALMLARSCLPQLKKSAAPSIVHVSSLAGGRAYPFGGPYGPSKAALNSLTLQMALEWAQFGIRANVVSPGTIDTPLMRANMRPEIRKLREERIPLQRLGQSNEVAELIVFLGSPAASYVTGQVVDCDGGLSQSLMVQKFFANRE